MSVHGTVYTITDFEKFIVSYYSNHLSPDEDTFSPLSNVRAVLAANLPSSSFTPLMAINTTTGSDGNFVLDEKTLPDAGISELYLIFLREVQTFRDSTGIEIPIFKPLYRSAPFHKKYTNISKEIKIYTRFEQMTNVYGITQDQINKQASFVVKNDERIDSLTARVSDQKIKIRGKGKQQKREMKFRGNILLRPSTTSDLNNFINPKIRDFEIEINGERYPVLIEKYFTMCIEKEEMKNIVKSNIENMVIRMTSKFNEKLINHLAERTNIHKRKIKDIFQNQVSITFEKFRFPVVGIISVSHPFPHLIEERIIVGDCWFGFPKNLY
jgi:hypothetical protein